MKKLSVISLILVISFILASCGKSSLVGIWEPVDKGYKMEFYENGTMSSKYGTGRYETLDDQLRIIDMGYWGQIISWEFKIKGDKLIIITEDGEEREYIRQ